MSFLTPAICTNSYQICEFVKTSSNQMRSLVIFRSINIWGENSWICILKIHLNIYIYFYFQVKPFLISGRPEQGIRHRPAYGEPALSCGVKSYVYLPSFFSHHCRSLLVLPLWNFYFVFIHCTKRSVKITPWKHW